MPMNVTNALGPTGACRFANSHMDFVDASRAARVNDDDIVLVLVKVPFIRKICTTCSSFF